MAFEHGAEVALGLNQEEPIVAVGILGGGVELRAVKAHRLGQFEEGNQLFRGARAEDDGMDGLDRGVLFELLDRELPNAPAFGFVHVDELSGVWPADEDVGAAFRHVTQVASVPSLVTTSPVVSMGTIALPLEGRSIAPRGRLGSYWCNAICSGS